MSVCALKGSNVRRGRNIMQSVYVSRFDCLRRTAWSYGRMATTSISTSMFASVLPTVVRTGYGAVNRRP